MFLRAVNAPTSYKYYLSSMYIYIIRREWINSSKISEIQPALYKMKFKENTSR